MPFTKILKDSIFPILCFIAMQVLALIIEPYSKTYLCESFYTGKGVIASLFTGFIYNFFVFSIYLLLFCVYFIKFHINKSQIIKIAIADIIWLIIVEFIKTIVYSMDFKYGMLLFFFIDVIYIFGVQFILTFVLRKSIAKSRSYINKFNITLSVVMLALITVISIMLYGFILKTAELGRYDEIQICIDSMIFKEYIYVLLTTVIFQTLCFMILLDTFKYEISAPRPTLFFITVLFAAVICALKLIFPVGMICKINRFSDLSSKLNDNEFYIERSAITILRRGEIGEYETYYSERKDIYIGDKLICKFDSNYTYEKGDAEKFESDGYRFLVIKNMLVAYADEKGHTGYILANGEMSDKSVTNLIGFDWLDWIEEPYGLLWENQ